MGVLVGRPRENWDEVHDDAVVALEWATKEMHFSDDELDHRRGKYGTVSHGLSFGGGQDVRIPIITMHGF